MKNKEDNKEKRRKWIIILILLLLLMIITITLTYGVFVYTKEGNSDNEITTGTIKLLYTENSGIGKGISMTNALPVSDEEGKNYSTDDYVFDFKITAVVPNDNIINYEVTARMSKDSDLPIDIVKLYLVEKNGNIEIPAPLTIDSLKKVKLFSELKDTTLASGNYSDGTSKVEKTLYNGSAFGKDYTQNFRLRMWVSEDSNFTGLDQKDGTIKYPYNDKTFSIKVNVYAKSDS